MAELRGTQQNRLTNLVVVAHPVWRDFSGQLADSRLTTNSAGHCNKHYIATSTTNDQSLNQQVAVSSTALFRDIQF